jgi:predicted O-methyltransferase YrrM
MVLETADSGVLYDLIVDDGGHSMKQQQASLEGLWDALKPGGVYIIEDLLTSYMSDLGGGYLRPQTTIEALKKMLDTLNQHMLPSDVKASLSAVQKSTQALLCWSELCALIKNP